jgi:hypothetical protein
VVPVLAIVNRVAALVLCRFRADELAVRSCAPNNAAVGTDHVIHVAVVRPSLGIAWRRAGCKKHEQKHSSKETHKVQEEPGFKKLLASLCVMIAILEASRYAEVGNLSDEETLRDEWGPQLCEEPDSDHQDVILASIC